MEEKIAPAVALTFDDAVVAGCLEVVCPVLAVGELAEAAPQVPREAVLGPVVGDVEQLEGGAAHHPLRDVVGQETL